MTRLGRQARAFLGGLDVLVNNAGITMNKPFARVKAHEFDLLYHVNIRAQFFLTQAVLGALRKSRGAIVNITSIHAFQGFPQHSVYAGTKGAIVAYTRELAIELAPAGIRVNAIAPGSVVVKNYYKSIPGYDPAAHGKLIPAGFVGEPRDIARAVVFLSSGDARFILGQTLIVDGGTTAWMPLPIRNSRLSMTASGWVKSMTTSVAESVNELSGSPASTSALSSRSAASRTAAHIATPTLPAAPSTPTRMV